MYNMYYIIYNVLLKYSALSVKKLFLLWINKYIKNTTTSKASHFLNFVTFFII